VIGVVPAAGHATRLGALDGSKELLEIRGKPVIEYLIRRLEAGGCSEIRLVTREDKHDLREYAAERGLDVVLGTPPDVGASVGLALSSVAPAELVALGYPDTLWEPLDGFALLRQQLDDETDVVLGLFETPDAYRSDVVGVDGGGRVREILVKPTDPPCLLVWGCLVGRAAAVASAAHKPEIGTGLAPLVAAGRVGSRFLSDRWLDIGLPAALAHARSGAFPSVA